MAENKLDIELDYRNLPGSHTRLALLSGCAWMKGI